MKKTSLRLVTTIAFFVVSNQTLAAGMKSPGKDKPVPAPPNQKEEILEARWEASNRDGRDWTIHAYDEVGNEGPSMMSTIPSDGESFCPGFRKLDDSGRKNFYVYLLSAMSKFESNYNPNTQYKEAFNDRNGNPVISRGLLQLSKESANGYGCGIGDERELHDPYVNLTCAIKILDRWVGRDGVISGKTSSGSWRGGARYWSVLRKDSTLPTIRSWTRSFCQENF